MFRMSWTDCILLGRQSQRVYIGKEGKTNNNKISETKIRKNHIPYNHE